MRRRGVRLRRGGVRRLRVCWPAAAALCALLSVTLGCGSSGSDASTAEPVVAVQVTPAAVQPISDVIRAQGVLYPIRQASLTPKITAPVRTFYVNRGSRVHRGELLAILENKDLAATVVAAKGSYDQAQATYASTNSSTLPEELQTASLNLDNAKSALTAQQQLYDSETNLFRQGAIARKQLDATSVTLTSAKSAYQSASKHLQTLRSTGASQQRKAAQGQLESAHGQYLNAAAQLSYTEMRSPIDGVIAERAVYPGDVAPAGTPLLIVMDTSKVIVRLHVPQSQAAELKLGDRATFAIAGGKTEVPARVTVISPAVDPSSTTVEIWVEADNAKGTLQPGGSVDVSIVAATVAHALVIPHAALLDVNGKSRVMVAAADGRAYSHAVTTGIAEGPAIQILSGLRPGEKVIVGGAYGLPDKTRITVTAASASQDAQQPDSQQ